MENCDSLSVEHVEVFRAGDWPGFNTVWSQGKGKPREGERGGDGRVGELEHTQSLWTEVASDTDAVCN